MVGARVAVAVEVEVETKPGTEIVIEPFSCIEGVRQFASASTSTGTP